MKKSEAFSVLGLSNHPTQEEIKSAYREKVKKYHPDVNPESDAEKMMHQLNEAYDILSRLDSKEQDMIVRSVDRTQPSSIDDGLARAVTDIVMEIQSDAKNGNYNKIKDLQQKLEELLYVPIMLVADRIQAKFSHAIDEADMGIGLEMFFDEHILTDKIPAWDDTDPFIYRYDNNKLTADGKSTDFLRFIKGCARVYFSRELPKKDFIKLRGGSIYGKNKKLKSLYQNGERPASLDAVLPNQDDKQTRTYEDLASALIAENMKGLEEDSIKVRARLPWLCSMGPLFKNCFDKLNVIGNDTGINAINCRKLTIYHLDLFAKKTIQRKEKNSIRFRRIRELLCVSYFDEDSKSYSGDSIVQSIDAAYIRARDIEVWRRYDTELREYLKMNYKRHLSSIINEQNDFYKLFFCSELDFLKELKLRAQNSVFSVAPLLNENDFKNNNYYPWIDRIDNNDEAKELFRVLRKECDESWEKAIISIVSLDGEVI